MDRFASTYCWCAVKMALQNRVCPDGTLHTNSMRGMLTGNRGVIHDPDTKSLLGKRWTTNAWICCTLGWNGRTRDVWGRNYKGKFAGWSELFFLDEVTALAAGHRPCHTCRRSDAVRFQDAWGAANGEMNAQGKNKTLHAERLFSRRHAPDHIVVDNILDLPDGAVIRSGEIYCAIKNRLLLPWSFNGYGAAIAANDFLGPIEMVTPKSIIGTLSAGYDPIWHPSAP